MLIGLLLLIATFTTNAQSVEYKVVTSIESIVLNGLGRSRLISANENKNYKDYTSTQTKDDKSRNKSKRSEIRVKGFDETKLLNFYNLGGIRFQNIATSDAGKGDGKGIFITCYIFKRIKTK